MIPPYNNLHISINTQKKEHQLSLRFYRILISIFCVSIGVVTLLIVLLVSSLIYSGLLLMIFTLIIYIVIPFISLMVLVAVYQESKIFKLYKENPMSLVKKLGIYISGTIAIILYMLNFIAMTSGFFKDFMYIYGFALTFIFLSIVLYEITFISSFSEKIKALISALTPALLLITLFIFNNAFFSGENTLYYKSYLNISVSMWYIIIFFMVSGIINIFPYIKININKSTL